MYRTIAIALMIAACASAAPLQAQQIAGPYGPAITLRQARIIVDAAHRQASTRGFTMAFAVVLPSGEPILLEVMDGTQSASITVSQAKARSAARYRRPTKASADSVNGVNFGQLTLDGMVAVEGDVPILAQGRVIGALGVSGGTTAQDGEIAAASLAAIKLD
ncbi:heme-binding protein [Sphingobium sufflavum]|uniref:GlcG/HbpS family heme-binding protein n=1 Tax=Sphingobium sufflavum TaxID=1129547 RepID=UPI001F2E4B04|nr:heme-binding protein [Sphingobium sufflavum]MCE7795117.1 heme-binding protein [Sphingobium sufflavum]